MIAPAQKLFTSKRQMQKGSEKGSILLYDPCNSKSYHSSNYRVSNSFCSFLLLKTIAKSTGTINATIPPPRAKESDNFCNHNGWKSDNNRESNQEKKQRNGTKNKAKKI